MEISRKQHTNNHERTAKRTIKSPPDIDREGMNMSEKQGLKIAIIGSGSTYTPELIDGFIRLRETLPVRQFMFMDIDDRKRTIVCSARRKWTPRPY